MLLQRVHAMIRTSLNLTIDLVQLTGANNVCHAGGILQHFKHRNSSVVLLSVQALLADRKCQRVRHLRVNLATALAWEQIHDAANGPFPSIVCKVENTKCRVSAAVSARDAVSASRISPT